MRKLLLGLLLAVIILSVGCAKTWDSAAANGGLFISRKAPYVVISQSGGEIMDVYILQSAIVQSCEGSDGWLFLDEGRHPIFLGGDVKTIRFESTNDLLFKSYHEYHMEDESLTYRELYNTAPKK